MGCAGGCCSALASPTGQGTPRRARMRGPGGAGWHGYRHPQTFTTIGDGPAAGTPRADPDASAAPAAPARPGPPRGLPCWSAQATACQALQAAPMRPSGSLWVLPQGGRARAFRVPLAARCSARQGTGRDTAGGGPRPWATPSADQKTPARGLQGACRKLSIRPCETSRAYERRAASSCRICSTRRVNSASPSSSTSPTCPRQRDR